MVIQNDSYRFWLARVFLAQSSSDAFEILSMGADSVKLILNSEASSPPNYVNCSSSRLDPILNRFLDAKVNPREIDVKKCREYYT